MMMFQIWSFLIIYCQQRFYNNSIIYQIENVLTNIKIEKNIKMIVLNKQLNCSFNYKKFSMEITVAILSLLKKRK